MSEPDTAILASEQEDSKDEIVHQILCSVEKNAGLSQRQLAKDLDIALGSVNWCLKRCISKGLIKIQQAPLKRYMYYLTPKGFEEKSRLTTQYLKHSFQLFRLGREEAANILSECYSKKIKTVYLFGDGDLAEIFILSAYETSMGITAIVDPYAKVKKRINVPVFVSPDTMPEQDAEKTGCIITDLTTPVEAYRGAAAFCDSTGILKERIFIPKLLHFSPESIAGENSQ